MGRVQFTASMKADIVKRLDAVVANEYTIFQNRSQLLAHCILAALPEVEREAREARR
jgi:hypothetical protein